MTDPRKTAHPKAPDRSAQVLHVRVGETGAQAAHRTAAAMLDLQAGRNVVPYFGIGFAEVGQMLAIFTPKRWELIAALRAAGSMTVAELARHLGRNYKNVHADLALLAQWMAVERADDGKFSVPWAEINVDMKLPQAQAA